MEYRMLGVYARLLSGNGEKCRRAYLLLVTSAQHATHVEIHMPWKGLSTGHLVQSHHSWGVYNDPKESGWYRRAKNEMRRVDNTSRAKAWIQIMQKFQSPKFEPFEDTQIAAIHQSRDGIMSAAGAGTISIYHFDDEFLGTISLVGNDNTNGSWSINGYKYYNSIPTESSHLSLELLIKSLCKKAQWSTYVLEWPAGDRFCLQSQFTNSQKLSPESHKLINIHNGEQA